MEKINAGYIIAWDGGTVFDYKKKQLLAGGPRTAQTTWNNHVEKDEKGKPIRKRKGKVVYTNLSLYDRMDSVPMYLLPKF